MTRSAELSRAKRYNFCFPILILLFAITVKTVNAQSALPTVGNETFQAIAQFYAYDANITLDATVVSKQDLPAGSREKVIFTGINHTRVPSYIVIPKKGSGKYPIVLIVDGIFGSKDRWFDDASWPKGGLVTTALLNKGFAVMILDAVYHGDRSTENGYGPVPSPWQFPVTARQMMIQTAIEYRRAIDYLSQRKDIDTSRIGMLGLSMGGLITFGLTSIDPRIKTAIAGLTPPLKQKEFQAVTPATFASHIACGSFLMFMGNKDDYYTMKEAHQLFDMIPVARKEFVEYNTGHEPPLEYVAKVADWFVKNLQ